MIRVVTIVHTITENYFSTRTWKCVVFLLRIHLEAGSVITRLVNNIILCWCLPPVSRSEADRVYARRPSPELCRLLATVYRRYWPTYLHRRPIRLPFFFSLDFLPRPLQVELITSIFYNCWKSYRSQLCRFTASVVPNKHDKMLLRARKTETNIMAESALLRSAMIDYRLLVCVVDQDLQCQLRGSLFCGPRGLLG